MSQSSNSYEASQQASKTKDITEANKRASKRTTNAGMESMDELIKTRMTWQVSLWRMPRMHVPIQNNSGAQKKGAQSTPSPLHAAPTPTVHVGAPHPHSRHEVRHVREVGLHMVPG